MNEDDEGDVTCDGAAEVLESSGKIILGYVAPGTRLYTVKP